MTVSSSSHLTAIEKDVILPSERCALAFMMAAADRKYLLVDHGKFGRPALHFLRELKAFDTVFTGGELPVSVRAPLNETGVPVTVTGKD